MADIPFPRILSIADRAYRALLYVYPAAHRRVFGPCMAQLFRDLCRDAVEQDGTFGLVELWIRTLLDLAYTALVEHLEGKGWVLVGTILEKQGLVPALRDYAGRLTKEASCAVHLEVEGDVPRLSGQAESALFDVVREAVSNARRHAQANHVWIALFLRQDSLEVSVRDDGQGFDLEAVRSESKSHGIDPEGAMRGRAEALQGALTVESAVGKGTTMRLVSPLTPNLATAGG
jgi:nitrate/nitrite-specific signal transduction histidine kinase